MEDQEIQKKGNNKSLKDYREDYYYFTGKASEVSRTLALGGIALVWIFKNPDPAKTIIPAALIFPAILFATSLFLDLCQYALGGWLWRWFFKKNEKLARTDKTIDLEHIECPEWIPDFLMYIYNSKIGIMLMGYIFMIIHLSHKACL